MTTGVCLVIIFNHKYDKNLPILRELYRNRFGTIRFLVPFYEGEDADVIPVYESSYQFQGFLAQARQELLDLNCTYYYVISDDLILNPAITENNFMDELGMQDGDSLITQAVLPSKLWKKQREQDAMKVFEQQWHTLYQPEIFTKQEAIKRYKEKGYKDFPLSTEQNRKIKDWMDAIKKYGMRQAIHYWHRNEYPYPILGGYSDWFIISRTDFEIVSRKLGVTAAMGLFVELAIPTIMVLYCKNVKVLSTTKYCDGALWEQEEIDAFGKQYQYSISKLLKNFPQDKLYIHPIKLSKWKE